jgi:hypothetical protein
MQQSYSKNPPALSVGGPTGLLSFGLRYKDREALLSVEH